MLLTILSILAAVITIGGGIAAAIRQFKKIAKRDDQRSSRLSIPAVDDSTEDDILDVSLDSAEEVALGLVVTDPLAHSAGTWTYPLQQELRKRGLTGAQATVALTSLTSRGLLEAVERETREDGSDRPSQSPAYRLTDLGLRVIRRSGRLKRFRDQYVYDVDLVERTNNDQYLQELLRRAGVHRQTRFIEGASEGHSRIRVWSDDPITREAFRSISLQTDATIAHWREVRY